MSIKYCEPYLKTLWIKKILIIELLLIVSFFIFSRYFLINNLLTYMLIFIFIFVFTAAIMELIRLIIGIKKGVIFLVGFSTYKLKSPYFYKFVVLTAILEELILIAGLILILYYLF